MFAPVDNKTLLRYSSKRQFLDNSSVSDILAIDVAKILPVILIFPLTGEVNKIFAYPLLDHVESLAPSVCTTMSPEDTEEDTQLGRPVLLGVTVGVGKGSTTKAPMILTSPLSKLATYAIEDSPDVDVGVGV